MQNLLRTKLFIPLIPLEVIPRPHLVERLNPSIAQKLSLVIAPAGYGKTTLVTQWLQQLTAINNETQITWLSLDEGDNDIRRFFMYFVAALAQLDASFELINETFLQDSRSEISTTAIVTELINQIALYGQSIILILDDYHQIKEPLIHEVLSFWLNNQPPNFHLIITSRVEPPLPLSQLRVRRQLIEINVEALRFSQAEIAEFLNQHMHLKLSADDISQLDSITEGWIASLQLIALSLQNKDNPTKFIQTFKGDNRYIVDYLVNEVLHRQPGYIRDFLLQTSILERLNVQLCNAVTKQVGSQHILEMLDQSRLFVIPLDDHRHWYRYHHLFAECLQAELHRLKPEEFSIYHERASHWFSKHGFLREAIHHAFTAGNNTLAAELIATNTQRVHWVQGEIRQLGQWIQQLPDEVIHTSPQLLIATAWVKLDLFSETSSSVEELLNKASTLVYASNAPYTPVEIANIATDIALAQASLERLRGNFPQAIQHCEYAAELIQAGDSPLFKAGVPGALAITHYQAGNIAESLKYSIPQLEAIGRDKPVNYARFVFLSYAIDALRMSGQLTQAKRLFERIEPHIVHRQSVGAAMLTISWAKVLYQQNHLTIAKQYLISALEILKPLQSMATIVQTTTIALAHIFQAQGKGQKALNLLQDVGASDSYSFSTQISAPKALLYLRQGNLVEAKAWAERSGLQATDNPTYSLEIDYLVLARVLIADGAIQMAQSLLDKLKQAAIKGGRIVRLIEIHTLQALASQALGEQKQALAQLEKAINLAQAKGFVRVFIDEGKELVPLFKQIGGRGVAITYIRQLLPLFEASMPLETPSTNKHPIAKQNMVETASDSAHLLLNPLTDRELATLRYLSTNLTIPEIAEQMVVAPSTIRTYIKRIYAKLDVHNRIEAVNRGHSLGLID